jgi:hypothetical protein
VENINMCSVVEVSVVKTYVTVGPILLIVPFE